MVSCGRLTLRTAAVIASALSLLALVLGPAVPVEAAAKTAWYTVNLGTICRASAVGRGGRDGGQKHSLCATHPAVQIGGSNFKYQMVDGPPYGSGPSSDFNVVLRFHHSSCRSMSLKIGVWENFGAPTSGLIDLTTTTHPKSNPFLKEVATNTVRRISWPLTKVFTLKDWAEPWGGGSTIAIFYSGTFSCSTRSGVLRT
jgi:hypothetical protein